MDISNKTSLKVFGAFALVLVFFVWYAYENQERTPDPVEKVAAPQAAAPVAPPALKTYMIYPFDMTMRRSSAFRIDGDLRPIWNVSGRIRNNSDVEVKSVSIRIQVTEKATDRVVDAATLVIDISIPPDSVGSFSRTVQLMPPETQWNWNYDVINAK
jgi:hypothetical protein